MAFKLEECVLTIKQSIKVVVVHGPTHVDTNSVITPSG